MAGPYTETLKNAREDTAIRNVAGACVNSPEFAGLINRVQRKLIKRGAWFGHEVLMRMCVYGCDIVWPRYVGTILGTRFCCYGNVDIKNNWYAIIGPNPGWNNGWNDIYGDVEMYDNGTTPFFNQITSNTGKFLRYQIVKQNDINKEITFFGTQYGGQPLQELNTANQWINGTTIAATVPIAQTNQLITEVTSVTRQPTEGMAYVYEYNPNNGDLRQLAVYEPNETNPRYRRSKMRGLQYIQHATDDNGVKKWNFEAMVKLEYIPATSDRDFLMISDFDAIAYGIQAITFDEAQDAKNAEIYWLKAISEMNFESRNKSPAQQFTTQVRVMGSNRLIANPI